jgi:hypothetical protein
MTIRRAAPRPERAWREQALGFARGDQLRLRHAFRLVVPMLLNPARAALTCLSRVSGSEGLTQSGLRA